MVHQMECFASLHSNMYISLCLLVFLLHKFDNTSNKKANNETDCVIYLKFNERNWFVFWLRFNIKPKKKKESLQFCMYFNFEYVAIWGVIEDSCL